MFKKLKDLKRGDLVVISMVPGVGAEIGTIVTRSERLTIVKSQGEYYEFYCDTGFSVRGEEFGKIMRDDCGLAIKEVPGIVCPHCGVSQKNFFMANEFLQGGKNFNCYNCDQLLWLRIDGDVRCPDAECVKCLSKRITEFVKKEATPTV